MSAVVALEVFKVQGQTQPELILYVLHASERAETRGLRLFRHAIAHVMYMYVVISYQVKLRSTQVTCHSQHAIYALALPRHYAPTALKHAIEELL